MRAGKQPHQLCRNLLLAANLNSSSMFDASRPILFFDGVCNLCNGAVQWIIRWDRREQFLFSPLQSVGGEKAKTAVGAGLDSIILFHEGRYFVKSDAALSIARLLGKPWSYLGALRIFPKRFRDAIYDLMARNRYRWFGKKNACMLPTPSLRARFLEDVSSHPAPVV